GMQRIKQLAQAGELGRVYALSLAFHNAFGPNKPWFYRQETAGGGCVLDLGVHLIDLALWLFDYPPVENVTARCYAGGRPLDAQAQVEDYASLRLLLANAVVVDIACSWHLPLGRDAAIHAAFHGSRRGASIHNLDGSFHRFRSELHEGCSTTVLYQPDEEGAWSARALAAWVWQLAAAPGFDDAIEGMVAVAEVIDAVYAGDVQPRIGATG